MKKCFLLLLNLLWISRGLTAGLLPPQVPPHIRWFTIETPHFYIHFHEGLKEVAEEIAFIAEKDYSLFELYLPALPRVRTHVVLTNYTDISNGFALPFPHPSIYLYLTPPSPYSELIYTKDYLESLFLHEFAHVIYLERAGGFPKFIRTIFGRVYFPNLFAPYLITEGYAVWSERRFLGRSRLKSSYYDMILRTAFSHGKEEKYSSFSLLYPSHWPYGVVPYLYGSYILDYIAREGGEECIDRYTIYYSENLIPFLVNNSFERACRISFKEGWERLKDEFKGNHNGEENAGVRITFTGNETRGVRFFDSESLVLTVNTMDEYPYIGIVNILSRRVKKLKDRNSGHHISVYDGVIYYSQMEYLDNFYLVNDIFSTGKGRNSRITKGGRWFSPERTRSGLYAIKRKPRYSGICNVETNECLYETQNEILSFRFSHDDKKVVFSEKKQNGNTDIGILDISSGSVNFITDDPYNDLFPLFSPDDRYVIFSSDRNHIHNLYAFELTSSIQFQITDVSGGVFESDVSPDGRFIATVQYGVDGFDVFLMEYNPQNWKKIDFGSENTKEYSFKYAGRTMVAKRYNGFKYLLPRAWLPFMWYGNLEGFFTQIKTGGADPLFKHAYMLDVYYQWKINKPGASLLYIEDSLYPTIIFHVAELPERGPIVYSTGEEFWIARFVTSFNLSFPVLRKVKWSLYAGTGYRFRWSRAEERFSIYSGEAIGRSGDVGLWFDFDTRKYYTKSFAFEDGVEIFGSYHRIHPSLGGEYWGEEWFAHFEGYKELFNWAVLFVNGDYIRYRGYRAPHFLPVAGINGDVSVKGIKENVGTDEAGSVYAGVSFPLYIDSGIGLLPLSFRCIYFSFYGGEGFVRNMGNDENPWFEIPAIGADFGIQVFAGYVVPLTVKVGISYGFREFSGFAYEYEVKLSLGSEAIFNMKDQGFLPHPRLYLQDILSKGLL